MKMTLKNINLMVITIIIFAFTLGITTPSSVKASFRAGPGTGSIDVVCSVSCGSDAGKLQLVGYQGNIGVSVWSRPFNFIRSDNNTNLLQNASVPINTNLTFSSSGSAVGSWWITGGGNDTPDMDNRRYAINGASLAGISPGWTSPGSGFEGGDSWGIGFRRPSTTSPSAISGGGVVSCTGGTCIANSVGSGSITVTFPGGSVEANVRPKYPNQSSNCDGNGNNYDCGQESELVSYSSQTFTYNLTVYQPNIKPTTSCQGVDNINYTDARIKWSYSDADGDPQSFARIQVSNVGDTGFSSPIINQQAFGASTRDYIANGLNHSTTYNYRLRVNDGKDPSDWVNCGTFQTRVNQSPTVNYTNTTSISYNTATANWTYSDPDGDPQLRYELKVVSLDGREDFNLISNGSVTNAPISGLRPGTIYIPKLRVENGPNGWTGWVDGPQFTTLVNNPPSLSSLSCQGITLGEPNYTSAKLEWNYTGTDEPGDILSLKARWKRIDESDETTTNLSSNPSSSLDITGLISGYEYEVQLFINDNRNSHLDNDPNRWKDCGTVTPPNYPEPNVSFNLEKLGDSTTRVSSGATLTVGTPDKVSANWAITNAVGVVENSCRIISTNTEGGNITEIYNRTGLGFTIENLISNTLPVDPNDQTYAIKLECDGKPALNKRDINETITLEVESYPVVSCSIDGTNTVKEGESNVNLRVNIDNVVGEYTWKSGVDSNNRDINTQSGSSSTNDLSITLDYSGIKFGKYNPWVEITKNTKNILKTCGTVSNLGSSTIREVN